MTAFKPTVRGVPAPGAASRFYTEYITIIEVDFPAPATAYHLTSLRELNRVRSQPPPPPPPLPPPPPPPPRREQHGTECLCVFLVLFRASCVPYHRGRERETGDSGGRHPIHASFRGRGVDLPSPGVVKVNYVEPTALSGVWGGSGHGRRGWLIM